MGTEEAKKPQLTFLLYPGIAPLGIAFGFGAEKGIEVNHYWCNS